MGVPRSSAREAGDCAKERSWEADALHVALATVAECRLIVSWNFRHIVHFDKIGLYNGVNMSLGYAMISIHAPPEVIDEN